MYRASILKYKCSKKKDEIISFELLFLSKFISFKGNYIFYFLNDNQENIYFLLLI